MVCLLFFATLVGTMSAVDLAGLASEHIDCRKAGLSSETVPKINGKADVASPKRIPAVTNSHLGAAILDDGGHREPVRAIEPDRIVCAAVEFEEGIAIPSSAMAKVRAFGQWSGGPAELTRIQQK